MILMNDSSKNSLINQRTPSIQEVNSLMAHFDDNSQVLDVKDVHEDNEVNKNTKVVPCKGLLVCKSLLQDI